MQRIDGPTVSVTLPAPLATGTGASAPGFFSRGDPVAGVRPTTLDADWANMIQEEIMAVLAEAEIAPDKTNHAQLLAAIQAIAGGSAESAGSNTNGRWEKRASGVVEQWGAVLGSFAEGPQAFNFPIPFPTACDNLQVTAINASSSGNHDIWAQAVSCSLTGGVAYLNYPQAGGVAAIDGFYWTAKGR